MRRKMDDLLSYAYENASGKSKQEEARRPTVHY